METYLTIEIDDREQDCAVQYRNRFGHIEITGMQDEDGNEICPDLLDENLKYNLIDKIAQL